MEPVTEAVSIALPPIVSREEWQAARDALLVKEKAHTRAKDALGAERRRLPMVEITTPYTFQGETGPATLLDLFEGRRRSRIAALGMTTRNRTSPTSS